MSDTPQRLDIAYRIVWQGDWHAGSGAGSAGVDRRIRRRSLPGGSEPSPFFPGSQLKGVLRHQCERLAALFGCAVVPPHQIAGEIPADLLANFRPLASSGLLIDRLFGSRYQGDCLFVDDALPEAGDPWEVRAHGRTAIDRLSGTARDRTLFISEVVTDTGRSLRGKIRARHPAGVLTQYDDGLPLEYALLLAGLLTIDCLGGDRSSGLGGCQVEILRQIVTWNGTELPLEKALSSFEEGWEVMLELVRGGATA